MAETVRRSPPTMEVESAPYDGDYFLWDDKTLLIKAHLILPILSQSASFNIRLWVLLDVDEFLFNINFDNHQLNKVNHRYPVRIDTDIPGYKNTVGTTAYMSHDLKDGDAAPLVTSVTHQKLLADLNKGISADQFQIFNDHYYHPKVVN